MVRKKSNLSRMTNRAKRQKSQKAKAVLDFVKGLVIKRPFCTVCKRFQSPEEEVNANVYEEDDSDDDLAPPSHNRSKLGTRWVTTAEATPVTGSQLLFKLFDLLDVEFTMGHVCKDCNHLVEQLDALQVQAFFSSTFFKIKKKRKSDS